MAASFCTRSMRSRDKFPILDPVPLVRNLWLMREGNSSAYQDILDPGQMLIHRVAGERHHFHVPLLEVRNMACHRVKLGGADWSEVSRVRKQNAPAARTTPATLVYLLYCTAYM